MDLKAEATRTKSVTHEVVGLIPSAASSGVRTGWLVFCFNRDTIAVHLTTQVRRRRRAGRLFDREANAQPTCEIDERVEHGIEDGRDQKGQHEREHLAADDHARPY